MPPSVFYDHLPVALQAVRVAPLPEDVWQPAALEAEFGLSESFCVLVVVEES